MYDSRVLCFLIGAAIVQYDDVVGTGTVKIVYPSIYLISVFHFLNSIC
jgi:hypothetical protein